MGSIVSNGGSTRPLLKEILRKLTDINGDESDAKVTRQAILEAIREITER